MQNLQCQDEKSIVSTVTTFFWGLQLVAENATVLGEGGGGGNGERSRWKKTANFKPGAVD